MICTFSSTFCLKPLASAVRRYGAGGSALNWYMPFESDVEAKLRPVLVSSNVTVAPETTAPWGSLTVPRRLARYCAWADNAKIMKKDNTASILTTKLFRITPPRGAQSDEHEVGLINAHESVGWL